MIEEMNIIKLNTIYNQRESKYKNQTMIIKKIKIIIIQIILIIKIRI